jgi:hypothetical protein
MTDDSDFNGRDEDTDEESELLLTFTAEGGAVLSDHDEDVWFSDDDEDFAEVFGEGFLEAEIDAEKVLNYLEEEGIIDSDEKGEVAIEQEDGEVIDHNG